MAPEANTQSEPKIRQIISEVLKHRGCSVTVCENGALAIAEIEPVAVAHHHQAIERDLRVEQVVVADVAHRLRVRVLREQPPEVAGVRDLLVADEHVVERPALQHGLELALERDDLGPEFRHVLSEIIKRHGIV